MMKELLFEDSQSYKLLPSSLSSFLPSSLLAGPRSLVLLAPPHSVTQSYTLLADVLLPVVYNKLQSNMPYLEEDGDIDQDHPQNNTALSPLVVLVVLVDWVSADCEWTQHALESSKMDRTVERRRGTGGDRFERSMCKHDFQRFYELALYSSL